MEANYLSLKEQQAVNHAQNRKSIHETNNKIQETNDLMHETKLEITEKFGDINVKLAKWSVVAGIATGVITAAAIKLFEHAIK